MEFSDSDRELQSSGEKYFQTFYLQYFSASLKHWGRTRLPPLLQACSKTLTGTKKSRTLSSSKFTPCLIDSAQEIDLIRNSPGETESSAWWEREGYKRFRSESEFISLEPELFTNTTGPARRMTESWCLLTHPTPPTPTPLQSAAHLAGFMGRELTSGRLPCYPSSVWKLIPSSVSRPRDPSAGDLTWVSAVCVTPTLPPVSPREGKLRRPRRLWEPRRSRLGDGCSQIFSTRIAPSSSSSSSTSNSSPSYQLLSSTFTCRPPPPRSAGPSSFGLRFIFSPIYSTSSLQLPACRSARWRSEPPVGAVKHYLPLSTRCRRRAAEL